MCCERLPTAGAATFLALFPIVDPFGGIPLFFTLTTTWPEETPAYRAKDRLLRVRDPGGVHFLWPVRAEFLWHFFARAEDCRRTDRREHGVGHGDWSSRMTHEENSEALTKEDISLTPMAMPMLSGPGSIGVVMGLAAHADNMLAYLGMILGILAIGVTVSLFLCLGGPFVKRLGPGTVGAINRIFGFLILAIAVQLVWDGVADFRG